MSRPQPRELTVIKKTKVSANMLRVTLGGDNISTIPDDQESGYVKLLFPNGKERPIMRTYTIRHQRPTEIDIDFVLHEDSGPASSWAKQTQPGDVILVGGPGPKKLIHIPSDWYFLAGDMTALPAISVNLSQLPDSAKGYAVIEVIDEQDIQNLKHPNGIEIKWVINSHPGKDSSILINHVKELDWLEGNVAAWVACEFNSMKNLRQFLKQEKNIDKEHLYISSYWKYGINEDQHKIEKSKDAELASA